MDRWSKASYFIPSSYDFRSSSFILFITRVISSKRRQSTCTTSIGQKFLFGILLQDSPLRWRRLGWEWRCPENVEGNGWGGGRPSSCDQPSSCRGSSAICDCPPDWTYRRLMSNRQTRRWPLPMSTSVGFIILHFLRRSAESLGLLLRERCQSVCPSVCNKVLGMTLSSRHRVIFLQHPGANNLFSVEAPLNNNCPRL